MEIIAVLLVGTALVWVALQVGLVGEKTEQVLKILNRDEE